LKNESGAKRPGTSALHPKSLTGKSLKTTRCGYKVNMAAMEDGKIDVVVRIKREQRTNMSECVFIYRTYNIMSHGGLQFY